MEEIDVQLGGVTKKYGKVYAVRDLTFGVKSKEMFFLLGPSGCGKSTTLRLIAGLEKPDKGAIKIKGRDMSGVPPHMRNVAIVFQTWSLWPHMTIYENIEFGLRMRSVPKVERKGKVEKALELMKLSGLAERHPRQLSGGEQQRAALARALVVEPEVLLLDEPITNLDLDLRKKMRLEIKRLQSELGITTIYVTHDQIDALCMADRIALMKDGRVVEIDNPINMYEHPKSHFAMEFLGESNLLRCHVSKVYGIEAVVTTKEGMNLSVCNDVGLSKGDRAIVLMRPEKVRVHKDVEGKGVNTFAGEVKRAIYLGSTIRYIIQLKEGAEISYEEKNVGEKQGFKPGQTVYAELNPSDIVCTRLGARGIT